MTFLVGQRVKRLRDVYDESSEMMYGMVVNRYSDYESKYGPYPELYEVRWDDGTIKKGYLPHGLSLMSCFFEFTNQCHGDVRPAEGGTQTTMYCELHRRLSIYRAAWERQYVKGKSKPRKAIEREAA